MLSDIIDTSIQIDKNEKIRHRDYISDFKDVLVEEEIDHHLLNKYSGDLSGLLFALDIPYNMHEIIMDINHIRSNSDFNSNVLQIPRQDITIDYSTI